MSLLKTPFAKGAKRFLVKAAMFDMLVCIGLLCTIQMLSFGRPPFIVALGFMCAWGATCAHLISSITAISKEKDRAFSIRSAIGGACISTIVAYMLGLTWALWVSLSGAFLNVEVQASLAIVLGAAVLTAGILAAIHIFSIWPRVRFVDLADLFAVGERRWTGILGAWAFTTISVLMLLPLTVAIAVYLFWMTNHRKENDEDSAVRRVLAWAVNWLRDVQAHPRLDHAGWFYATARFCAVVTAAFIISALSVPYWLALVSTEVLARAYCGRNLQFRSMIPEWTS